jgi:hypothetical protein
VIFTLRVDLDYVPWDSPDAEEFGHGEPAVILRLLELGRSLPGNFHFFVSNRVLRAFPSQVEAILSDNHDVDWLCKHPLKFHERWPDAEQLFAALGHEAIGIAVKEGWPADGPDFVLPPEIRFLTAEAGPVPPGPRPFLVETKSDRMAVRAGLSARLWAEGLKQSLRASASLGKGAVVSVRPQVLAKLDPKLHLVKEMILFAQGMEMRLATFRDQLT